MRKELFIFCCALTACTSGGSMMTNQAFFDVPLGSSLYDVIAVAGEPYAVHNKDDGSIEYEYIERFKVGSRDSQERHYFLLIKDGKVVSKRVEQSSSPPYIFDSYEMQTTQTVGKDSEE